MDNDQRELLGRLFATATALIESAHDAAVAGQSADIAANDYAEAARRLQATARSIAVLAEAAMIVANPGVDRRRNRRKHPR